MAVWHSFQLESIDPEDVAVRFDLGNKENGKFPVVGLDITASGKILDGTKNGSWARITGSGLSLGGTS